MRYVIEVEDLPYTNACVVTESGEVVSETRGELLYKAKGLNVYFTIDDLRKMQAID